MPAPLILASASPRRAELLASAGYEFTVEIADIDESLLAGEPPDVYALRLARGKARQVAGRYRKSAPTVLGADTTVVACDRILGKPENASDAVRMLTMLAGAVHEVLTAVVIVSGSHEMAEVVHTRVHFSPLSADEIEWYVSTGEPEGKAGGYAIQGRGARFVDWIDGSWSNVVGLPIATVARMLRVVGA